MYVNIFDKIKKPVFYRESDNTKKEIDYLKSILDKVPESQKKSVENNIKNLEYCLSGEDKIKFELRNINEPLIVLQDIYLQFEDLSCQIDFIVFTRYNIYILESKNMYGSITITNEADFIRTTDYGKERIYSPITQVKRHRDMMIKIRSNTKNSQFLKNIIENNLYEKIIPLVVIANDKTFINSKYAPKDIKTNIINVDNLTRKILLTDNNTGEHLSEKNMIDLANFFLENNKENPKKYFNKYKVENNKEKSKEENLIKVEEIPTEINIDKVDKPVALNESMPVEKPEDKNICPLCCGKLILRKSSKGKFKGNEFYGCSNYPKCKYIRNKETQ